MMNHRNSIIQPAVLISIAIKESLLQLTLDDETPEFNNSANCLNQYRHKGVSLANNITRVHMFLRAMKTEGREYQIVHTAWGQFAFILEDMDIFENQRPVYMPNGRSYRLFNTSFRYCCSIYTREMHCM